MAVRQDVLKEIVVIYFKYPDGSKVRCLCTSNAELLAMHGILQEEDYLYDLEVKKKIPDALLTLECEVYKPDEDTGLLEELDKFFNDHIKRLWVRS